MISVHSPAVDSAFDRLVSAIAAFGDDRSANASESNDHGSFASQLAAAALQAEAHRRPSHFASEFRSVLE